MLQLAAADEQAADEAIGDWQGDGGTQRLSQKLLVASCPDQGEEATYGDIPDAPDTHQREVKLPGLWLGMLWETQAGEMVGRAEHGVEPHDGEE